MHFTKIIYYRVIIVYYKGTVMNFYNSSVSSVLFLNRLKRNVVIEILCGLIVPNYTDYMQRVLLQNAAIRCGLDCFGN